MLGILSYNAKKLATGNIYSSFIHAVRFLYLLLVGFSCTVVVRFKFVYTEYYLNLFVLTCSPPDTSTVHLRCVAQFGTICTAYLYNLFVHL